MKHTTEGVTVSFRIPFILDNPLNHLHTSEFSSIFRSRTYRIRKKNVFWYTVCTEVWRLTLKFNIIFAKQTLININFIQNLFITRNFGILESFSKIQKINVDVFKVAVPQNPVFEFRVMLRASNSEFNVLCSIHWIIFKTDSINTFKIFVRLYNLSWDNLD